MGKKSFSLLGQCFQFWVDLFPNNEAYAITFYSLLELNPVFEFPEEYHVMLNPELGQKGGTETQAPAQENEGKASNAIREELDSVKMLKELTVDALLDAEAIDESTETVQP
jgi:hypothetical protein